MWFHLGLGTVETGFTVEINLAGDAVSCVQNRIIESVKGVGIPQLGDFLFFLILDDRLRSGFNTSENRIDKIDHHCDGTYQQAVWKSGYEF